MSEVLAKIAARIRANVSAEPPGKIDVAKQRAVFDHMGRGTKPAPGVMVSDAVLGGIRCDRIEPAERDDASEIIYFHGGAFSLGTRDGYRAMLGHVATACRATVVVVEYRLAPEHPFPAAPDDAFAVWRAVQAKPARRVIMGDSAGGNLALATMIRAREEGLALPQAAVLLSPWLDLDFAGASMKTNAEKDPLIREADCRAYAALYLNGRSPRDPLASPLYAELSKLPPIYIQASKDEVLLDDSTRLVELARAAGASATLDAFADVFHVWHFVAGVAPEADDAIAKIGDYVQRALAPQNSVAT